MRLLLLAPLDRVLSTHHDLSLSRGLDLFNILRSWQSHDTLLTVVLLCLHASLRDDAVSSLVMIYDLLASCLRADR
jgi:hypothetical protein